MSIALHRVLEGSAQRVPDHIAVEEGDEPANSVTYRELAELSGRVRDRLHSLGVVSGDRVGVYMRKSVDAVATIFGIPKLERHTSPWTHQLPPSAMPTFSTTARCGSR
jgi:acyl-CoA synthetase (AMP-forming)/AMP-acid ligase II